MKDLLKLLTRELNPVHDLDRFHDFVYYDSNDIRSLRKAINQTPSFGKNTFKHLARGAFIGALAGIVYSYLTNTDIKECTKWGISVGAIADSVQYWIRGYVLRSG